MIIRVGCEAALWAVRLNAAGVARREHVRKQPHHAEEGGGDDGQRGAKPGGAVRPW